MPATSTEWSIRWVGLIITFHIFTVTNWYLLSRRWMESTGGWGVAALSLLYVYVCVKVLVVLCEGNDWLRCRPAPRSPQPYSSTDLVQSRPFATTLTRLTRIPIENGRRYIYFRDSPTPVSRLAGAQACISTKVMRQAHDVNTFIYISIYYAPDVIVTHVAHMVRAPSLLSNSLSLALFWVLTNDVRDRCPCQCLMQRQPTWFFTVLLDKLSVTGSR